MGAGSDYFDDVPAGHWADQAIGWAVANGITDGVEENRFDLNGTVTRSEIVTYLHRTVGMLPGSPSVGIGHNTNPTVGKNAIALQSDRDGDEEIFVANLDGTNQYQLTHNIYPDSDPVWSPDGTQIAFQNPFIDLFVVNTDGTNLRRIRRGRYPVWSPDSTQIAFISYEHTTGELSVINADGTDRRQLTSNDHHDRSPTWSPDGTQIAFQSDRTGRSEIFVADADGTNQRQLTEGGGSNPMWSPDDTRLAFTRQDQDHSEVYVISPAGANQFRLTRGGGSDLIWSPDGKRLALTGVDDNGDTQIHIADFFGDDTVLLSQMTYDNHNDFAPRWSPDGTKIVYLTDRYGISLIAMGPNSLLRLGLNQPGRNPMWSPNSSQIIFEIGGDVFVMDQYGRDKRRLFNLRGSDIFHDVPTWHKANVEIGWAVTYGVTAGVGEGLFDPNGTVTRAQIITFLHRLVALVRLSYLDMARSPAPDPDEGFEAATVRMGIYPCCADLAFWQIPIEKGWLEDLNIRIDPPEGHMFVTSSETVAALQQGDLDVVTAWIPHALEHIEIDGQTFPPVLVADIYAGYMILVAPDSPAKTALEFMEEGMSFTEAAKAAVEQLVGRDVYIPTTSSQYADAFFAYLDEWGQEKTRIPLLDSDGTPVVLMNRDGNPLLDSGGRAQPITITSRDWRYYATPRYNQDLTTLELSITTGQIEFAMPYNGNHLTQMIHNGWDPLISYAMLYEHDPASYPTSLATGPSVGNTGLLANREWVAQNRDTVFRLLSVAYRTLGYINDPKTQSEGWTIEANLINDRRHLNLTADHIGILWDHLHPSFTWEDQEALWSLDLPGFHAETSLASRIEELQETGVLSSELDIQTALDEYLLAKELYFEMRNMQERSDELLDRAKASVLSDIQLLWVEKARTFYEQYNFYDSLRYLEAALSLGSAQP